MTTLASAATGSRWKVNSSDEGMSLHDRLVRDVRCGMFAELPTLPPRWFYDCIGSRLFERITMLPEYYPTRRETEILAERADEIAPQSVRARSSSSGRERRRRRPCSSMPSLL